MLPPGRRQSQNGHMSQKKRDGSTLQGPYVFQNPPNTFVRRSLDPVKAEPQEVFGGPSTYWEGIWKPIGGSIFVERLKTTRWAPGTYIYTWSFFNSTYRREISPHWGPHLFSAIYRGPTTLVITGWGPTLYDYSWYTSDAYWKIGWLQTHHHTCTTTNQSIDYHISSKQLQESCRVR